MRNVAAARAFRWQDVDPYVRRHGASRANLWGGLGGAAIWLPILAIVLAVQGRFDAVFLAALGVPYLALLAVLGRKRARAPAMTWQYAMWAGVGAYGVYVGALVHLVPSWGPLLSGTTGVDGSGAFLGFGAVALVVGVAGAAFHRRHVRRVPRISGTPPQVA
jgi:hypothetical protein